MAEILHKLHIKASPGKIYRALTDQRGLSGWWTIHTKAEPVINSIAEFTFDRGRVIFRMKVIRLISQKAVVWHCIGGHPEWETTQIMFQLEPKDKGTNLYFSHRGWRSTNGILPECNFEWARYLTSLRSYVEKGRGYPSRN